MMRKSSQQKTARHQRSSGKGDWIRFIRARRHFRTKMKVKVKREYFRISCCKIHTLLIIYPFFICYVFKKKINFLSNVNFSIYYSQRIVGPYNDYNLLLHLRTPKSKDDQFLINLIWILNIWVRFPYNPKHSPCMQ